MSRLLVDVEGCLRRSGRFDERLAEAVGAWAVATGGWVVVWSSEPDAAEEGGAWLEARLGRPVEVRTKDRAGTSQLQPTDVAVDDDVAYLTLVRALGAEGRLPGDFIGNVLAESGLPSERHRR